MEHAVDPLTALATKLLGPLTGHKGVDHLPKRHLTEVTGRCRYIQGDFLLTKIDITPQGYCTGRGLASVWARGAPVDPLLNDSCNWQGPWRLERFRKQRGWRRASGRSEARL